MGEKIEIEAVVESVVWPTDARSQKYSKVGLRRMPAMFYKKGQKIKMTIDIGEVTFAKLA